MGLLGRSFRRLRVAGRGLARLGRELEDERVLTGALFAELIRQRGRLDRLAEAEFRVFSQFGEDGIIQYLVNQTGIVASERSFIEFGVESYEEANTRFLLIKDNWRGLIMDGSDKYMRQVRESALYWRHNLIALTAFIDRDNINDLIASAGFSGKIGILSIDIDGNDFWVLERIDSVDPVIMICEYNSIFGPTHAVTVPYDPVFMRGKAHYSHLYWGCSLAALELLANRKGYDLVGSNSAGNNAFFVRRDRLGGLTPVTARDAWVESQFREARDMRGRLTYLSGAARIQQIRDMPVVDLSDGATKQIGQLYE